MMRKALILGCALLAGCAQFGEDPACQDCADVSELAEPDAGSQPDPHAGCVFDSTHDPFRSGLRESPLSDELEIERSCADPLEWTVEPLIFVDGEETPFSELVADGVAAGQLVTVAYSVPGDEVCRSSAFNPTYTLSLPDHANTHAVSDGYWLVGQRATDYWAVMEVDTFPACTGSYTLNIANTPFTIEASP